MLSKDAAVSQNMLYIITLCPKQLSFQFLHFLTMLNGEFPNLAEFKSIHLATNTFLVNEWGSERRDVRTPLYCSDFWEDQK